MKKFSVILSLTVVVFSCHEKSSHADSYSRAVMEANNPRFHFSNGSLFLNDTPYSGFTAIRYPNGRIQNNAEYLNGKENGFTTTYYDNGEKLSERYYTNGMKDSIATGWWPGGIKKFEYHFKDDVYNGAFTEYYSNGQPAQQIMYDHGKELSGQGWRENGKLYMNFTWKGNRRYGLVNPNMCYGIAKGEVRE